MFVGESVSIAKQKEEIKKVIDRRFLNPVWMSCVWSLSILAQDFIKIGCS
jgi:hypothetical protein